MDTKFKKILKKNAIFRIFISLPYIFFMTFLFFRNFIRSIEFTLTMFFTVYILNITFEFIYESKTIKKKPLIYGSWFILMIIGCIILKFTIS